jgi:hypothetical protein
MNYPIRYLLYSTLLLGVYNLLKALRLSTKLLKSTYPVDLTYLLLFFLILSIFGNYLELEAWSQAAQSKFILWHWYWLFSICTGDLVWFTAPGSYL